MRDAAPVRLMLGPGSNIQYDVYRRYPALTGRPPTDKPADNAERLIRRAKLAGKSLITIAYGLMLARINRSANAADGN